MINKKTIAVVVPAYNEETQVGVVIETMPAFVDRIVIVNDCSTDLTADVIKKHIEKEGKSISIKWNEKDIAPTFFNRALIVEQEMLKKEDERYPKHEIFNDNDDDRIVLINNLENARVGGAIAVGYKWCRDHSIDCTAVMAGDAQMDPEELESICMPVVEEDIDYVKGNRLSHFTAEVMIPPIRRFGNAVLSAMTKLASGYWRVSDTQTGYTAISLRALKKIKLWNIYRNYGMPNDMLIKLNIAKCTLREIDIKPVYGVGEKSKMNIKKVIRTVSVLLVSGFFKRIFKKYLINDFHPIILLYTGAMLSFLGSLYFSVYVIVNAIKDVGISPGTFQGLALFLMLTVLLSGLAMWIDMFDNDRHWK